MGDNQLWRCPRKGHHAGDRFVRGDSQRIQIAAPVHPLGRGLFRRNIFRRTHKDAGACQAFFAVLFGLRNAEIGQEHVPGGVNQNILRLDVAMHRALRMRVIQRLRHRLDNRHGCAQPERAVLLQHSVERTPVDVLHCEVTQVLLLSHIEDFDDVGVVQVPGSDRFALESPGEFGIRTQMRRKHLECNNPLQRGVQCPVDPRHTAAPDFGLNDIAAQLLTDQICQLVI